ncbi:MAG: helix-turn-helix domain-containing protein [Parvibaculaceae bacterium]|nr:helix-turn-helix domain-containing protein [Parvibaculaceae bacterium]
MSLFHVAAASNDFAPSKARIAAAIGLQENSVYEFIWSLIRDGELIQHGGKGARFYTVTSTGRKTKQPSLKNLPPVSEKWTGKPPLKLPMPRSLTKVDATLSKIAREEAAKTQSEAPWWSKPKAKQPIYTQAVGAQRDKSWCFDTRAIIDVIADECGVSKEALMGRVRSPKLSYPRWLVMYFMRTRLDLSYPQIGYRMERDHTTVIYGIRKVQARIETDEAYAAGVKKLHDKIKWRVAA